MHSNSGTEKQPSHRRPAQESERGTSPPAARCIGAEMLKKKTVLCRFAPFYLLLAFVGVVSCFAATGQTTNRSSVVRVLLITGVDYPGHLWRQTAPVLVEALRKDSRLSVFTVEDPNFLDSAALQKYDVIVLHFQNWEEPGPGHTARENLRKFVQGGKGLMLLHFACGAWHGEWPEFGDLAGRVWAGPGVRQHDPYGRFLVEPTPVDHPISRGLKPFETQDELYTCLTGDHPIEVLAQAKSKVDSKFYPMAFVSTYGKGRSFHTTLGHDTRALSTLEVQELLRRGCLWIAGLEIQ
jgi:uncharacterized protein